MEADLQRGGGSKAGASGITRDLYSYCLPLAAEFDATKGAEKEAFCQAKEVCLYNPCFFLIAAVIDAMEKIVSLCLYVCP